MRVVLNQYICIFEEFLIWVSKLKIINSAHVFSVLKRKDWHTSNGKSEIYTFGHRRPTVWVLYSLTFLKKRCVLPKKTEYFMWTDIYRNGGFHIIGTYEQPSPILSGEFTHAMVDAEINHPELKTFGLHLSNLTPLKILKIKTYFNASSGKFKYIYEKSRIIIIGVYQLSIFMA